MEYCSNAYPVHAKRHGVSTMHSEAFSETLRSAVASTTSHGQSTSAAVGSLGRVKQLECSTHWQACNITLLSLSDSAIMLTPLLSTEVQKFQSATGFAWQVRWYRADSTSQTIQYL